MNFLLDLDDKIVLGKAEDYQDLENYAQDEITNNYDIVDTATGFSKSYPIGELITYYVNHTDEVDGIDFDFTDKGRRDVGNILLSVLVKDSEIPTINEDGGLPMVAKKKVASKKSAVKARSRAKTKATPAKKATATSGGTRASSLDTQKVKRGEKPKNASSVAGAIYAHCTKQMTVADICSGMEALGYAPPRRSDPADAKYLKGYISAMLRSGELEKV